jgi:hypothetical protein
MSEPEYRPEDFEDGEVAGVYEPNPDLRVWLQVEVGPPDSNRLMALARRRGIDTLDLAREFIREGLIRNVAVVTSPTLSTVRSKRRSKER